MNLINTYNVHEIINATLEQKLKIFCKYARERLLKIFTCNHSFCSYLVFTTLLGLRYSTMYSYIFLTKLISNNMYNAQFTTLSKSCTCNRQILLQKIHYYSTCVQNERKSQQTHIPSALPLLDATHDEQQGIKGIYLIYFTFFPSISIWFILTEIFASSDCQLNR